MENGLIGIGGMKTGEVCRVVTEENKHRDDKDATVVTFVRLPHGWLAVADHHNGVHTTFIPSIIAYKEQ